MSSVFRAAAAAAAAARTAKATAGAAFRASTPLGAVGAVAGSVGAAYLAHELALYSTFTHEFPVLPGTGSTTKSSPSIKPVPSSSKEWLIIGRQSPGYARTPAKDKKTSLVEQIEASGLAYGCTVGTAMDNEGDYDLLPGSSYHTFTGDRSRPDVVISPEHMLNTDINKISDTQLYVVGFARKRAFADTISEKSPLFHSSIALRLVTPEHPADPEEVVITGKEVKTLVAETNKAICHAQHCDLYSSNCYSASLYFFSRMIGLVATKEGVSEESDGHLRSLYGILRHAVGDNFSRGVSNNPVVRREIVEHVVPLLESRHLLTLAREKGDPILGMGAGGTELR